MKEDSKSISFWFLQVLWHQYGVFSACDYILKFNPKSFGYIHNSHAIIVVCLGLWKQGIGYPFVL